MSTTSFPWTADPQQIDHGVQKFIDYYKPCLLQNQIELLEHFKDKIYGFHLQSLDQINPSDISNEAIFAFEHAGVKGEITVSFPNRP